MRNTPVWFLPEDAADLESVELVANEVLAMQMPTTPAQLQNLTNEIRQKVGELGGVEAILEQSTDDIQRAEELLEHARRAKSVLLHRLTSGSGSSNANTSSSVVTSEEAAGVKDSAEKVKEALQEARKAQTAASSAIQQASADIQSTNSLLSSVSTG